MQIAIISDVHNNEINLGKVLRYCSEHKVEQLICCGDLASREILEKINDEFSGTNYYTAGNADYDELRDLFPLARYRNSFLYENFGEAEIDGKIVAFVHFPDQARKLAKSGMYHFVFYGHTHKPWIEKTGACTMLNPGNVTGDFYPPTFAVWNTENNDFKLIRVHNLP